MFWKRNLKLRKEAFQQEITHDRYFFYKCDHIKKYEALIHKFCRSTFYNCSKLKCSFSETNTARNHRH
jgi:hypothetical protein